MNLTDLTIGIEEEFQIIDPKTRELTSFVTEFLERGAILFKDQVKPEMLQSQVEIGSSVCRNVREVRQEVTRLRGALAEIADKSGARIVAAGTHPFSSWRDQLITNKDRYKTLVATMSYVARRLLIFGMHIHIGIPNRQLRIDIMNQLSYFMPHVLALSTSSPFWLGQDTGFKSYRSVVFEDLPRTGLPDYFSSAEDYDAFVEMLIQTECIDDPTKIWWDIRPHPKFPTLEVRICDCCTKIDEAIAIAALVQAIVAKLVQLRLRNQTWRQYRRTFLAENKWRAIKDGLDGKMVDFGKGEQVPVRLLIEELLELVEDVVKELRTEKEIGHIRQIVQKGTSADRQLQVYRETGDLKTVVDRLAVETVEGC